MNGKGTRAKENGAGGEPLEVEVRRLGEALAARKEDVRARTVARSREAGSQLPAEVWESFEAISLASTAALALWMAGGRPEEGRNTSRKAFETYGQLAAQRIAPLNEVSKRSLRWRDSVGEVLAESATDLGVSTGALHRALAMVQRTVDVTLVRMCECFESERRKTR